MGADASAGGDAPSAKGAPSGGGGGGGGGGAGLSAAARGNGDGVGRCGLPVQNGSSRNNEGVFTCCDELGSAWLSGK